MPKQVGSLLLCFCLHNQLSLKDAGQCTMLVSYKNCCAPTAAETTPFYPTPQSITGDRQLQAFLADLSVGGPASIPGFPAPSTIFTSKRLAGIAAQVMWLAGVQHHAVNSDKVKPVPPHLPGVTAATCC
jgi:hypothetical protein